jgi:hypothetical protein
VRIQDTTNWYKIVVHDDRFLNSEWNIIVREKMVIAKLILIKPYNVSISCFAFDGLGVV